MQISNMNGILKQDHNSSHKITCPWNIDCSTLFLKLWKFEATWTLFTPSTLSYNPKFQASNEC